jgi:hypothetical protein
VHTRQARAYAVSWRLCNGGAQLSWCLRSALAHRREFAPTGVLKNCPLASPEELLQNGLLAEELLSVSVAVRDGHVERVRAVLLVLQVGQEVDQVLQQVRQSSEIQFCYIFLCSNISKIV